MLEALIADVVKTKYVFERVNELNSECLEEFIKIKDNISSNKEYDGEKLNDIYRELRGKDGTES